MMYPYTKFELHVCNSFRNNERKPIMRKLGNTICTQPFHDGGIKTLHRVYGRCNVIMGKKLQFEAKGHHKPEIKHWHCFI
jgi:hypothetical protein